MLPAAAGPGAAGGRRVTKCPRKCGRPYSKICERAGDEAAAAAAVGLRRRSPTLACLGGGTAGAALSASLRGTWGRWGCRRARAA